MIALPGWKKLALQGLIPDSLQVAEVILFNETGRVKTLTGSLLYDTDLDKVLVSSCLRLKVEE